MLYTSIKVTDDNVDVIKTIADLAKELEDTCKSEEDYHFTCEVSADLIEDDEITAEDADMRDLLYQFAQEIHAASSRTYFMQVIVRLETEIAYQNRIAS